MDRFRISLAYKVLTAFIIILLPILAVFLITYRINKTSLEEHVMNDLRLVAEDREADILLFMEMMKGRIEDFASDGYVRQETARLAKGVKDGKELGAYLANIKLPLAKNLYRLSVLSPDGFVIASSIGSVVGRDESKEEFFKNGMRESVFAELIPGYHGAPELAVASPINDLKGRTIGVMVGIITLDRLGKLFTGEYGRELGALSWEIKSGQETLEIYIVNRDKLMITESWLVKDTVLSQRVDTLPVRSCLEESKEVSGAFYLDYRGMEVAGVSMCFPRLGWTMLVEVDKSEILAPVKQTAKYAIMTFAVTIFLIAFLVFTFFRLFINQLRTMAAAAVEIGRGNYDVALPVSSSDEIGLLADAFNNMARGIRERDFALRQSETRLESIIDNTTNVIYMKDFDGRYILINRRFEELFSIGRKDIAGKTDFDLFPQETALQFRDNDLKALRSETPLELEERVPQQDGVHIYLSVKFGIKDPDGRVYAVCGVSTDITERTRMEEALRLSEASLANAQRIARIGNWDWDMVTDELRWSDEVYRIFGVKPQEFGASYESFLSYVHPEDREFVESSVKEAFKGEPYSIDHRIVLPGSRMKIVHEHGEVIFDELGNPVRMSGTVQDVTDMKRVEEEVRKLNTELEKRVEERTLQLESANRELEAFSYSVAHDLKSPIRIIEGFSNIMSEDYGGMFDEKGIEHLDRIKGACHRMNELIDDLLELSAVTRAELSSAAIDMSSVARELAEDLRKSAPQRQCEFLIQEGLEAVGDEKLLRAALENLLGNAWKFTSKKPKAFIEFGSMGKADGKTVFYVRDNGAGFDMKHYNRLFSAFQRLHSADEFPGTGVGLATVQRIISRHGGKVWAEAEPGKGATFFFTL